jgi:hypothetical protein
MLWSGTAGTTISPWSGRPRDCPPASTCGYAVEYARPFNRGYLKPIGESNDASNGFLNDFWNGF